MKQLPENIKFTWTKTDFETIEKVLKSTIIDSSGNISAIQSADPLQRLMMGNLVLSHLTDMYYKVRHKWERFPSGEKERSFTMKLPWAIAFHIRFKPEIDACENFYHATVLINMVLMEIERKLI